jgi:glycosyltransferase involved in cell wall biosynthesis
MRLLFLSNFFPPHIVGGYELLCADVRDGLRRRGHAVDVLTSRHGVGGRPAVSDGVHRTLHLEVDLQAWSGSLRTLVGRRRRLAADLAEVRDVIAASRPDAVLVWGMWNLSRTLPSLIEAEQKLPIAYYVADYWPTLPDASTLHWRAPAGHRWTRGAKALLARVIERWRPAPPPPQLAFAHAACVSAAVRAHLVEAGLPFADAHVIRNGIDLERFSFRPSSSANAGSPLAIGYAGRLDASKGVGVLLDALALFAARGASFRLTLATPGSAAAAAAAIGPQIDRLGLRDAVSVRAQVPAAHMPAFLAGLDVLVVPSVWPEPLARIIAEGMASGIAVVATAVGGTAEIITDGVDGLLCPAGDPHALAACLTRLHGDPALRGALARAGRQTATARFDLSASLDAIEQLLEQAVASAGQVGAPRSSAG